MPYHLEGLEQFEYSQIYSDFTFRILSKIYNGDVYEKKFDIFHPILTMNPIIILGWLMSLIIISYIILLKTRPNAGLSNLIRYILIFFGYFIQRNNDINIFGKFKFLGYLTIIMISFFGAFFSCFFGTSLIVNEYSLINDLTDLNSREYIRPIWIDGASHKFEVSPEGSVKNQLWARGGRMGRRILTVEDQADVQKLTKLLKGDIALIGNEYGFRWILGTIFCPFSSEIKMWMSQESHEVHGSVFYYNKNIKPALRRRMDEA